MANAVAVDGSNNVIVTGSSSATDRTVRLHDDQVFERGSAALDQPLQRAGQPPRLASRPGRGRQATT